MGFRQDRQVWREAGERRGAVREALGQRWPDFPFSVFTDGNIGAHYSTNVSWVSCADMPAATEVLRVAGACLPSGYGTTGRRHFVSTEVLPTATHFTLATVNAWKSERRHSAHLGAGLLARDAHAVSRKWVGDCAPAIAAADLELVNTICAFANFTEDRYVAWYGRGVLHRARVSLAETVIAAGEPLAAAIGYRL